MSHRIAIAIFPVLLLILAQVMLQARVGLPILDGVLIDTDSYMRMVRVTEFAQNGDWYDRTIDRSNASFGETLHWTKPLDLLILAGAALALPFMSLDQALFTSGVLIGPVLHLLTLLVLLWATETLFPASGRVYVGVLFIAQLFLSQLFALGRVDHHGLFALIVVALIGLGLRLLSDDTRRRTAILAGIVAATGLWVGVEGLFGVAMILAMIWTLWIWEGGRQAKSGAAFSITLTIAAAFFVALEHPPSNWLSASYDIISCVHVLILALIAMFWIVAGFLFKFGTKLSRFVVTIVFGLFGLGLTWLIYPDFFAGPLAEIDPRVFELWFSKNQEVQPIADLSRPLYSIHRLFLFLGTSVIALPFIVHILKSSAGLERRQWFFITGCYGATVLIALLQIRWTAYAQLFAILPAVGLLLSILDVVSKRIGGVLKSVSRAAIVLAIAIGPPLLSLVLEPKIEASATPRANKYGACNLRQLASFLNTGILGERLQTIMSYNSFGPELLYRTPHRVISTPYHRNAAGILAGFEFFGTNDLDKAREIIVARNIDLIVICPGHPEAPYYRGTQNQVSMHDRLVNNKVAWAERVESNKFPIGGFMLYLVARQ